MKEVLIIGSKGMLGQELVKVFSANKDYETIDWDFCNIDITDQAQVKEKILALSPQIIINAAAYNTVDKAEEPTEFELAKKINGLAPGYLAQVAKKLGAIFVHYSTDYVFDGQRAGGYLEDDKPSPLSNYGRSKLLGEQEVARVGGQYYIVRLQKLFGCLAQSASAKKSFFEIMLELAQTKKSWKSWMRNCRISLTRQTWLCRQNIYWKIASHRESITLPMKVSRSLGMARLKFCLRRRG